MAPRRRQGSGKVPAGLASTGHLAGQPGHVQGDNVALARVPWRVGVGLHTSAEARHGGRPRGPEAHPGPRLPNPVAWRPGSGRPGSPTPAGSLKPGATSQVGSEGAAQATTSHSRGQENLQRAGRHPPASPHQHPPSGPPRSVPRPSAAEDLGPLARHGHVGTPRSAPRGSTLWGINSASPVAPSPSYKPLGRQSSPPTPAPNLRGLPPARTSLHPPD